MRPFDPQPFGNYVLTAHLGRGGMADVFRAQRTGAAGFERTVVVKRILPPYNDDPAFVQMFINEAKIAAKLTHPNIAQVYELGEVDGEYFIALEYVKGLDLLRMLKSLAKRGDERVRAIPPEAAAFIAREVCRGLGHAHDHASDEGVPQPIIHRDVSPQNIMVAYDGQVKLVDFGIAKAMFSMREETRTGAIKGKIAYMSPEQVTGGSPSPESDVFSTGVVLYEMLIGRRLFKGQNDFETISRVKTMPIPPPSRVASWVPAELDQVVMRALERDRAGRYSRASMMARDLDAFLASRRYSVEEMGDWVTSTFPPEVRDEVPDGASRTPSRSPSSRSGASSPSLGGSAASSGSRSARSFSQGPSFSGGSGRPSSSDSEVTSPSLQPQPADPPGGRRTLFIAAAALGLVVGVAALVLLFRGAPAPADVAPPLVASPPAPPAPDPAPAPKVEPLPAEPPPAPTPTADVEPTPSKPESATPTKAARPSSHSSSTSRPTPTAGKPKPKIEILEDEPAPPPKVEAFDD